MSATPNGRTGPTHPRPLPLRGGCVVSFLGIDGGGKHTIAAALQRELAERGHDVHALSCSDYLRSAPAGPAADLNRALYDASLRAAFSKALTKDGVELGEAFGSLGNDPLDPVLDKQLALAEIVGNNPHSVLAAAVCEIASGLAYRPSVLWPRLEAGQTLIETPHPVRMAVKLALLAQQAGRGTALHQAATTVLRTAATLLRPNSNRVVPVLVRCAPETALALVGTVGPTI